MIPNQWYPVYESGAVHQQPVCVRRLDESLALWRDAAGRVRCAREQRARYDEKPPASASGASIELQAFTCQTQTVCERHGLVWLWWGRPQGQYPELPWFPQSAELEASAAARSGTWNVNYARFIENSLDVHHFPFVHPMGPPGPDRVVEPSISEFDGEVLRFSAGLKRRRGDPDPSMMYHIEFRFPAIVHTVMPSHEQPRFRFIQAACPIDETTSWMYTRFYQHLLRRPFGGRILSWAAMTFDWEILQKQQDLPLFETQQPRVPSLSCGYKLIKADHGVYLYLRERERLQAAALEAPHSAATA